MKKRWLGLLLILTMMLCLLPAAALAEGENERHVNSSDALLAAIADESVSVIHIDADLWISEPISIERELTLRGKGGNQIVCRKEVTVKNGGALILDGYFFMSVIDSAFAVEAGGALTVECLCPECNEDQGSTLHMRACGHYACSPGFDVAAHSVPECGIAGHCTVDGAAHGKCRNCQKPLCNGEDHGVGVCQHEHMWVQKSYTAATATTDGHSVAECMTCGIVYEQVFPATGG